MSMVLYLNYYATQTQFNATDHSKGVKGSSQWILPDHYLLGASGLDLLLLLVW